MSDAETGPEAPAIRRESVTGPDALALIGELTAELAGNDYPEQSTHGYRAQQVLDRGRLLRRPETGARQHAALAFYRRAGFTVTDPFPPYRPDHDSLYMQRRLGR